MSTWALGRKLRPDCLGSGKPGASFGGSGNRAEHVCVCVMGVLGWRLEVCFHSASVSISQLEVLQ